ncbi:MAG: hypothetical protein U5N86_04855 [Planctomycetota bacterium]|nr:hypothetical protein [Planctomycetota bacterium]
MKFIRASVTLLAFMIAALAFTATAHAAYTPTLSSPSNNAEFQAADNLDCSWTAGSDTPDHYIVTWALDSAMTDVLFEYETTDTSYSISGLPGLKTVYWQVTAVDAQDNEYPSSVWSFGTTTDGEESAGEETVFKLDFEDRSYEPDGWTASGPDWRTWSYNNNVHLLRYIWYYDRNENSYLTQNSSFVCGPDAELAYKWAQLQLLLFLPRDTEKYRCQPTTVLPATALYDHYAQNNYRYWPGGSTSYYPYSWKTQTVDFSDYAGQSIRLRFWVYTSSNSYSSWMMDDFTFKQAKGYEGTKREVTLTSDYSDPVPGSSVEAVYGNPVTVNVGSQFYSPAGMPEVRYVYDHFTGTGSFPVYGESASVTKKVFRTSTVTFEWIKQYKFTVYSPDDRGDPDPNGLVWADQGAEMTFEVQQPTVAGVVPGTRWLCSGWEGTGNFPPDGIVPSVTVESVSISSTLTWLWKIQYRLTIINPWTGNWRG